MRFLVLTHLFGEFTGSEINALQLCMGLQSAGHHADIGSFEIRGPLIDKARLGGIEVLDLLQDDGPALDYDIIWAHHAPVLTHLLFRRSLPPCKVIFSSLSPLTPMESPPTYHRELPWVLAHSPFNVSHLIELTVAEERIHYFPNFAPKDFFDAPRPHYTEGLRRIVIVSNHQPEEVIEAAKLFRADGLQVDFIGRQNPLLVDPTVLPTYDLVITIGKTVQYAFSQRVLVYCYDHFGGPGYINDQNFEKVRYGNFCGRTGFMKLTGAAIYTDVKAGYETAATVESLDFLRNKALSLFSLEANLSEVCAMLEITPITDIAGLRRRHGPAGRLNDIYMTSLRHRLNLEATVHELTRVRPQKPFWRKWFSRFSLVTQ